MPCIRRLSAWVVVVGVVAIVGAGCGDGRKASGFCAEVERGHTGFDSTRPDRSPAAIAQLDQLIVFAPRTLAPDLKTMSTTLSDLHRSPTKAIENDPALFAHFAAAVDRIDQYLRDECGLPIPRRSAT